VHGIISGHQGHISVESTPGKGTCVTVRLPINRLPESAIEHGGNHGES